MRISVIALAAWVGLTCEAGAFEWINWRWKTPDQPCLGDCAVMAFGGRQVRTDLEQIIFDPVPPWKWDIGNSTIAGATISRRVATLITIIDVESELGVAKRFGNTSEAEVWGAFFFRFSAFPWNSIIYTTVAVSTGLNYASGISDWESVQSRINGGQASRLMHYFSPEITLASPDYKALELVFRMHHRSGVYGILNDATGTQYMTAGLRWRF